MALSPSYPSVTKALASEVFLCLAHTPATHQFLASDFVISGMLKTLVDQSSKVEDTPAGIMELVGLRCAVWWIQVSFCVVLCQRKNISVILNGNIMHYYMCV